MDTVGFITYLAALLVVVVLILATTPKARAATACQPGQSEHLSALAAELKVPPSKPEHIAVMSDCQGRTYDVVRLMLEFVRQSKVKK